MPGFEVEIDEGSGFCFGVVNAIAKAEKELEGGGELHCLGDIVHNGAELARLRGEGLKIIDYEQFGRLRGGRVLFRAHGEPPSTYAEAERNGVSVIDATCPVVLNLQKRIRRTCESDPSCQIAIYGKAGHAEVNGLVGQTEGRAIVIESEADADKLDFGAPIALFSQTTMPLEGFEKLKAAIMGKMQSGIPFSAYDTICRQVSGRMNGLKAFASSHDLIIFVGGLKSSNAKALFEICRGANPLSRFVSSAEELEACWFEGVSKVGVCGATSTPKWQMQQIKDTIIKLKN